MMENNIERLFLTIQEANSHQDVGSKEKIRMILNDLIENNFEQLVQLLYRVDVNENKLKKLLLDHPTTDAASLIADLLIERQMEKNKSKTSFQKRGDISDEEKW